MAFFTFYTELAPAADLSASPSTWSWTDVTPYVGLPGISITRGRGDPYSEASPDRCALTFLNNSGRFVPRNPLGPYYGRLARNTPLRVMIRPNTNSASDAFNRTSSSSWGSADAGGAWTNTGGAASDFSVAAASGGRHLHTAANVSHWSTLPTSIGRVDEMVRIRVNATSTGAAQVAGLAFRWIDANASQRVELQFGTDSSITARLLSRSAGVDSVSYSAATGLTHSTSSWYWLRVQTQLTSSRAKVWLDGTAEPSTWLIDGINGFVSSTTAGTFGTFSRRETGNTNASATVDFDTYSMVDGPRVQFTGFVDEWPVTWADHALTQSYAPVTASGQLRRMSRTLPLRSAIYRKLTSDYNTAAPHVVAYWPMEDGSNATSFASGIGGKAYAFTDMRPGSQSGLRGSDPLPVVGPAGRVQFTVPPYPASSTWAVRFLFRYNTAPAASAQLLSWSTPGGTFARWQLTSAAGTPDTIRLEGYNSAGTATFVDASVDLVDFTSGVELTAGRQLYFEVRGTQNGGNIDLGWTCWFVPDDGSVNAASIGRVPSVAGTNANVTLLSHDASSGLGAGGHTIGHIAVGNSLLTGPGTTGVTGGAAASTRTRFGDVCDEQNVIAYFGDLILGTGTTTQLMGPQRPTDTLSQLREIEATELGVLYDGKQGFLHLLPRGMRQNRAVGLTLNVAAGQVGWPLAATDDDFLLRNDVTVTEPDGSFARATADLATIQLQGVHADQVQVNPYRDDDLVYQAQWRKNAGLVEDLRYSAVVIDLTRNHLALADAWCDCDIGSRIQVTNVPANELPPDNLDFILEGYTETISSTQWRVEANTSSMKPWNVVKLDDTSLARIDLSGSTLAAAVTSGATSLLVSTPGTAQWSATSVPYDINIGGEKITFTAVAASGTDTFTRTVSNGWGTATSGQAWTIGSGTTSDFSTTGTKGRITTTTAAALYYITVDTSSTDHTVKVEVPLSVLPTGAPITLRLVGRWTDSSNYYEAQLSIATSGAATLSLNKRVAGAGSAIGTSMVVGTHAAGNLWIATLDVAGSTVRAKAYNFTAGAADPGLWQVTATDTDLTTGTRSGVGVRRESGNLDGAITVDFDNLSIPNPQTVTATRSVNTVVKAQTAGTTVRLWSTGVLAV